MNTSTEHILQCNQSEPLADASQWRIQNVQEAVSHILKMQYL